MTATRQNAELAMPPKESERLSAEQLGSLRQWIAAGAPWPAAKKTTWDDPVDGVTVVTSGGRSADWTQRTYRPEDLWALQRVGSPTVSPDGRWVAFTVPTYSRTENKGQGDLWLVETNGKTPPRRWTSN